MDTTNMDQSDHIGKLYTLNTTLKNIQGKDFDVEELSTAIQSQNDTFTMPQFCGEDENKGIKLFNVESQNPVIKEQREEQQQREHKMKTHIPDIDTFLIDEFSFNGMRNLYGKDKDEPDFRHCPIEHHHNNTELLQHKDFIDTLEPEDKEMKLTACQVTTHFHHDNTYFVVHGYERGEPFSDGTHAQGRQILRVYKMEKGIDKLPNMILLNEVLNNQKFDYTNYKNYLPIYKKGLSIYYFKIKNMKKEKKVEIMLHAYHLDREKKETWRNLKHDQEENPKILEQMKEYYEKKERKHLMNTFEKNAFDKLSQKLGYPEGMFATHISWVTHSPTLQVGPNAFRQQARAIVYFRTWEKSESEQIRVSDLNQESTEKNFLIQIDLKGEMWEPMYPDTKNSFYEYQGTFREKEYPQQTNLWLIKDDQLMDIFPKSENNQKFLNEKEYKMAKPFYTYRWDNGYYRKEKMTTGQNEDDFDKFISIFNIDNEKHLDILDHDSDDDNIHYEELQTMSIINDTYDIAVFYVYGSSVEFRRYINQRYKPMNQFDKKNMHVLSRFAHKHNTGSVHETYKNVFMNYKIDEDTVKNRKSALSNYQETETNPNQQQRVGMVYLCTKQQIEQNPKKEKKHEDKEDHWLRGRDNETQKHIFDLEKYKVYDLIDGQGKGMDKAIRIYNIPRVENRADNPYIRFRIVGGKRDGLSIQFSTYDEDKYICQLKVQTYFDEQKYKHSAISWSSSMYWVDQNKKRFNQEKLENGQSRPKICQNLQFSQMSEDGIFCRIVEYEISWPRELKKYLEQADYRKTIYIPENRMSPFQINMIGMKVVLFNGHYEYVKKGNWFYPMYDKNDEIIGTQWIPDSEIVSKNNIQNGVFYQLKNYSDEEFQYETNMVRSCLYNYYSAKINADNLGYIVIESQIANDLDKQYDKFRQHEVLDILNTELRCLLNMKKTSYDDIFGIDIKIDDYDFLQSMEVLGRQCIADYFLLDPEQIYKFCMKYNQKKEFKNLSVIEDFLQSKGYLQTHKNFFMRHGLYRGKGDISFDRNHFNTLYRCFDNGITLQKMRKEAQQRKSLVQSLRASASNAHQSIAVQTKTSLKNKFQKIKNMIKSKPNSEENEQIKQKAVFQMSGNHLLNYVLNKKPSVSENRFIFFLLEILIEEEIQIERFFENDMQFGVFNLDEQHKSFASLVQMDSLPASSRDIHTIRLLGDKQQNQHSFDFTDDKKFLKRYFTNKFNEYKEAEVIKGDWNQKHRTESSRVFFQENRTAIGLQDEMKQHRVQNFMIDRSYINLDRKKIQLLNLQTKKQLDDYLIITEEEQWDLYQMSQFFSSIQQKYGKQVEENLVLRKLIDALFEGSKRFYYWQIFFYLCYVCPFFWQLIALDHINDNVSQDFYQKGQAKQIILMNVICWVIALGFFLIELIQIKVQGLRGYWNDARPYEILWFFFQTLYYILKLNYPSQGFPLIDYVISAELNGIKQNVIVMLMMAVLNAILIALILFKLFYFFTIWGRFGTMVRLISTTFEQVYMFLLFYFLMLFVFSCWMICLGYDMQGDNIQTTWESIDKEMKKDGKTMMQATEAIWKDRRIWNENSIFQYFIQTFLDSVGQLNPPSVPVWSMIVDYPNKPNHPNALYEATGLMNQEKWLASVMNFSSWIFFFLIVIFLFIILANFLIAYITQSYEDVLESKIKNIYMQRCTLNDEYYLFRHYLDVTFPNWCQKYGFQLDKFNCFLLTADFASVKENKDHDNIGVIRKIQSILYDHKDEIAYDIIKNRNEMERVRDEMVKYRSEMLDLIHDIKDTKENITSLIKSNLNNNNYTLYDCLWPDTKIRREMKRQNKEDNGYIEKGLFMPLEPIEEVEEKKKTIHF